MKPPTLSVLIVAANSGSVLAECVGCVLASELVHEVLVLDNQSSDGVPELIEREHFGDRRVRVIRNQWNLGFGPAMNQGAMLAHGDVLLLLNPDCLPSPEHVVHLLQTLRDEPNAGLVGAVVCDEAGRPDPASRRRDPLLKRSMHTLWSRGKDDRGVEVTGPMPDGVVDVEAVSGALMLVPRTVFESAGGFDEHYFLHCEDLDLCRRLRDLGYRVLLDGRVHVTHVKGTSGRGRPIFVSRHKHRGMWRWFRKFDPAARNPLLAALVWCGIWSHFALGAVKLWLGQGKS